MDKFILGDQEFTNRMIIGTGKYASDEQLKKCIENNDIGMITVALRRMDVDNMDQSDVLRVIDREKITVIPNTSGARDVDQAINIARICRASGLSDYIKVEITKDMRTLLPDPMQTYQASRVLIKEGFKVLPYVNADPELCKILEEIGCIAVMPLGAPIGTGKGLTTLENIKIIVQNANVPVIVDAGIGRPSHAALAMEVGCDAVMLNSAISGSDDPIMMSEAFNMAVKAGRKAYLAGVYQEREEATPSSELKDLIHAL